MWYSFHIYGIEPINFFVTISNDKYKSIKKFFIYYTDVEGFHVRLRIFLENKNKKNVVFDNLSKDFNDYIVLEKLYDPEYNILGEKLDTYEEYSAILSRDIIEKNIYKPSFNFIKIAIFNFVVEILADDTLHFLEKYKDFWKDSFFIRKFNSVASNFNEDFGDLDYFEILNQYWIKETETIRNNLDYESINKSLLFKICHMTFNKLGYTIFDEVNLFEEILNEHKGVEYGRY